MKLHLDFETRSPLDIKTVGLDRYARTAEVLMMAWAVNEAQPELWIPKPGEPLPDALALYMARPEIQKVAWRAQFERAILKHCLDIDSPVEQWIDPKVMAQYASIPSSLKGASEFLGLGELAKHEGSRLIAKFCRPRKNGTFLQPEDAPVEWRTFCEYCLQDVVAERACMHRLEKAFTLPAQERELWELDAEINERGMPVDLQYVRDLNARADAERARLKDKLQELTGLKNPGSNAQMLKWAKSKGYPFSSLLKKKVDIALADEKLSPELVEVLKVRSMASRSSVSKLDAMLDRTAEDGRARYLFNYYGASKTGRWSGSGVQPQNLPR
jgi:DNA polymerase